MRIQSLTLDYPPRRNIGSELFTHQLNLALSKAHEVHATTNSVKTHPGCDGIPVQPFAWSDRSWADLYICHADFAGPVISRGRPVVGICHNTQEGVLLAIHSHRFTMVVCNSDAMASELAARDPQNYMVVHPTAPLLGDVSSGDLVTLVNLNQNKVGSFWDIATVMPEQRFLAVLGGYGDQIVPDVLPPNVEVLGHVSPEMMQEKVWSRTRLLLAPSERESWNMTAGEAIAYGIPVLSTDHPGVRENLRDAATYLDRDDVDAWVAAIRQAPPPSTAIQARARNNRNRHENDVARFVEAVTSIGASNSEAA